MAKNYLFAPFKDDNEKIKAFKSIRDYIPKKFRNELIMFIGSLESYYDAIISHDAEVSYELDDKHIKIIKDLEMEIEEGKLLNTANRQTITKLKAEIKSLSLHDELLQDAPNFAMIKELKAEIESLQDQLKDVVNDYDTLLNSNSVK